MTGTESSIPGAETRALCKLHLNLKVFLVYAISLLSALKTCEQCLAVDGEREREEGDKGWEEWGLARDVIRRMRERI